MAKSLTKSNIFLMVNTNERSKIRSYWKNGFSGEH